MNYFFLAMALIGTATVIAFNRADLLPMNLTFVVIWSVLIYRQRRA